ncbi:NAD-binding protein, partial [Comamonas thiooxydans]|uniref:NAD-binding protein n=1 Tax=Comamonas thiooxydans TaxID=363952 RepID=UPI00209BCF73
MIVGHGDVGQRVARLLVASGRGRHGIQVLALSRSPGRAEQLHAQAVRPLWGDLDDL